MTTKKKTEAKKKTVAVQAATKIPTVAKAAKTEEPPFSTEAEAKADEIKGAKVDIIIVDDLVDPLSKEVLKKAVDELKVAYIMIDGLQLKPGEYSYSELKSTIYLTIGGEQKELYIDKHKWQELPHAGDILNFKDKKVYANGIATFDILYPEDLKARTPVASQKKEEDKSVEQLILESKKAPMSLAKEKDGIKTVNGIADTPIGGVGDRAVMVKSSTVAGLLGGLQATGETEAGISAPSSGASL